MIYDMIPTCIEFNLKLNFYNILIIERYFFLKYPLSFRRLMRNRNVLVYISICFVFDTTLTTIRYCYFFIPNELPLNTAKMFASTFILMDLALIFGGLILNIYALLEIRPWKYINNMIEGRRNIKQFRTVLFLFGISIICIFTVMPSEILIVLLVFIKSDFLTDNDEYVIFLTSTFAQAVLYPVLNDIFLVSTNPMVTKSIAAKYRKIAALLKTGCSRRVFAESPKEVINSDSSRTTDFEVTTRF